jgi:hypothetical protein
MGKRKIQFSLSEILFSPYCLGKMVGVRGDHNSSAVIIRKYEWFVLKILIHIWTRYHYYY